MINDLLKRWCNHPGRFLLLLLTTLLAGCTGTVQPSERAARQQLAGVAGAYRPRARRPPLPVLTTNSDLGDFLRFALLNQPEVEAKYYDWLASVENITVARSLPDPKLTFQAYVESSLTSLMPGLAQDFPGPGKLPAAARVAAAASQSKYFEFEAAMWQTAFEVKSAYYNLYFLDERLRLNHEVMVLLADLEKSARAQNETGKATLPDIYRVQNEQDQHAAEMANLEDSRRLLLARFKAALGLVPGQPDPPVPVKFHATPDMNVDDLLAAALAHNPQLQAMASEVRQAEASIALARKSKEPDFSADLMTEIYRPPFYWPQASVSLPVWRDKIAAQIAAAQAGRQAAAARLTAAQINLAVDFARQTYDYRESTRNLALLENQIIPRARRSLEIARAGYLSGQVDFSSLIEAEHARLDFMLQAVQERTRREIALAGLSLLLAGIPPEGNPLPAMTQTSGPDHASTP